jgi:hypothetical protein
VLYDGLKSRVLAGAGIVCEKTKAEI